MSSVYVHSVSEWRTSFLPDIDIISRRSVLSTAATSLRPALNAWWHGCIAFRKVEEGAWPPELVNIWNLPCPALSRPLLPLFPSTGTLCCLPCSPGLTLLLGLTAPYGAKYSPCYRQKLLLRTEERPRISSTLPPSSVFAALPQPNVQGCLLGLAVILARGVSPWSSDIPLQVELSGLFGPFGEVSHFSSKITLLN